MSLAKRLHSKTPTMFTLQAFVVSKVCLAARARFFTQEVVYEACWFWIEVAVGYVSKGRCLTSLTNPGFTIYPLKQCTLTAANSNLTNFDRGHLGHE